MKKFTIYTVLPIVFVMTILACDSAKTEEAAQADKQENDNSKDGEQLPDVTADRMLVVELEGMVCQMGCGGEIRKELYSTNGVEQVKFDFDEENPVDVAHIAFDREKVSADRLIEIISAINGGQFSVKSTRSEPYVSKTVSVNESNEKSKNSKKSRVQVKTPKYENAPDLFDVFSFL